MNNNCGNENSMDFYTQSKVSNANVAAAAVAAAYLNCLNSVHQQQQQQNSSNSSLSFLNAANENAFNMNSETIDENSQDGNLNGNTTDALINSNLRHRY